MGFGPVYVHAGNKRKFSKPVWVIRGDKSILTNGHKSLEIVRIVGNYCKTLPGRAAGVAISLLNIPNARVRRGRGGALREFEPIENSKLRPGKRLKGSDVVSGPHFSPEYKI